MSHGVMELAKNTLLAQRAAMQVVGHNIANANTEGYVRQVVVMEPIPGAMRGAYGATIGHGARIVAVKRLQNVFVTAQIHRYAASLGRERATEDMLSQVEAIFAEFSESGITDNLNRMFSGFEQIGMNPTNLAARQETVVRAGIMADIIGSRYEDLNSLRVEINERLGNTVEEANVLAQRIADLNVKMGEASTDAIRNDLENMREGAMSRLSELTGAYFIERSDMQIDVLIGGRRIVQANEVTELRVELDPGNPGMQRVCLGAVAEPDGLGGALMGLVEVRDGQMVEYMARLDTFAETVAEAMNVIHGNGYDLNGDAGEDFFVYVAGAGASTLEVNANIVADPGLIAAAKDADAVGDGSNASEIAQLRDTKVFAGTQNPTEYYADLIGQMGSDTRSSADMVLVRESVVRNLQANYEAISGVSLDEEAADLIRYQQVYNAAAQLMQTSIEMMDALFAIG